MKTSLFTLLLIPVLFVVDTRFVRAESALVSCPEHSFVCEPSGSIVRHKQRIREAYGVRGDKQPENSVVLLNGQPLASKHYRNKRNQLVIEGIDLQTRPSMWGGIGNSEGGLVIEAGRNVKQVVLHNINIHSRSGRNTSRRNQAPLILHAPHARKVDMYDVNVTAHGLHLTNIDDSTNECVGLACIHAPEAKIRLDSFSSSLSGENFFLIE